MDVFMPHLGASVDKGTILTWYKGVGEKVSTGDILFEVESDKASIEIEAIGDGILAAIHVAQGVEAAVGAVIATIVGEGEAAPPAVVEVAPTAPAVGREAAATPLRAPTHVAAGQIPLEPFNDVKSPPHNFGPVTLKSGVKVTPLARRLAAESGVHLDAIMGSGPYGKIMARDVRDKACAVTAPAPPSQRAFGEAVTPPSVCSEPRELPLDRMRSTIAQRMTAAKRDTPHFYISTEVEIDRLVALRAEFQKAHDKRITLNDFLIRAIGLGVMRTADVNRIFAGDKLLEFDQVDLGIAVAITGGLVTPVIRDVGRKALLEIADETAGLVERARSRKLRPLELDGGVGTLSNLGMYGVDSAQAIINPPQAFILAAGAARLRPRADETGATTFVNAVTLTMSADHRVLDGANAAALMANIKALIETPVGLLR